MGNWRLREVRVTWRLSFLHCVTNYNKLGGLKQHRCDLRVCGSGHSSAGSCAQALPRCWLSGGLIWSWGSTSKLLRWLAESRGLPPECESLEATLSMWYKTRLFASPLKLFIYQMTIESKSSTITGGNQSRRTLKRFS